MISKQEIATVQKGYRVREKNVERHLVRPAEDGLGRWCMSILALRRQDRGISVKSSLVYIKNSKPVRAT